MDPIVRCASKLIRMSPDVIEFVVLAQLLEMVPKRNQEWCEAFLHNHIPNWRAYAQQLERD